LAQPVRLREAMYLLEISARYMLELYHVSEPIGGGSISMSREEPRTKLITHDNTHGYLSALDFCPPEGISRDCSLKCRGSPVIYLASASTVAERKWKRD